MIFPIPQDYKGFDKYPSTHILLALNIFIFFVFFWAHSMERNPTLLDNSRFMEETKRYYLEWYLNKYQQKPVDSELPSFVYRGLTDPSFMSELEFWNSNSDPIEFSFWRNKMKDWNKSFTSTPLSLFGLKPRSSYSLQWITYQFSHSDLFHLLSNICFLFVLGIWIEELMGSLFVVGLYLLGGLGGAWYFCYDGVASLIPMVGASASVSALISFAAFYGGTKGMRYFYLIAPWQGWYGTIYLPGWLLIPFYLISYITAYVSRGPEQVTGIAHSAHIGGAVVGIILALLLNEGLFFSRSKSSS